MANKPEAHKNLIPVRDFAKTRLNRFGNPVSNESVYKLIRQHKLNPKKDIDFQYVDKGIDGIWIVKTKNNKNAKNI